MGQFPKTPLRDLFTAASADCLNLLSQCLIYDPKRRISAKDVSAALLSRRCTSYSRSVLSPTQALNHPYFFALPYPSHPMKLPKPARKDVPLEEMDGNVEMASSGPGVKANPPNKLKRKHSSEDFGSKPVARRLDFSK